MLSHHKEVFHPLAEPVARLLLRLHLRPNHLTVAGFGVSVLAAHAFANGRLRAGAILLALAGLFDFFDGALARAARQETPFGAFLDSVVDRYSDMVVLFGVMLFYHRAGDTAGTLLAMLALGGTVMVSYTKARAQSIGVQCETGLMERPERLLVLVSGAALNLLTLALTVLAVLTNLTAIQRLLHTRRLTSAADLDPSADAAPGPVSAVPDPEPILTRLATWTSSRRPYWRR
jgi:CDP-diacylglycerol---glycerol-3-phosphate 3-phosphatidyltransferase